MDPHEGHLHIDVSLVAVAAHTGVAVETRIKRREKEKHTRGAGPRSSFLFERKRSARSDDIRASGSREGAKS